MRIETPFEQLFYTTVIIESQKREGTGTLGTGFIINVKVGKRTDAFLVTNKHVICGATEGILRFHLSENGKLCNGQGYKLRVPNMCKFWIGHKDSDVDIAVMSMSLIHEQARKSGKTLFYKAIPQDLFPTDEQLSQLDAVEDLAFVGYPTGIYDQENYLPVLRRAFAASPLQVDYEGKPIFLVDASVFPGSSGSPVLLVNTGQYSPRGGGIVLGNRVLILGIIASVHCMPDEMATKFHEVVNSSPAGATQGYRQMIDLGVVYKSRAILELAMSLLQ